MRREDGVVGLILAAIFGAALWEAWSFQYSTEFAPGPGFAPVWLSAIGVVLSLTIAAGGLRAASRRTASGTASPDRVDRSGLGRVVSTLVALVVTLALVAYLGFVTSVLLFLLFLTLFVQRLRPVVGVPVSLITVALVYVVFVRLLGVPMPVGPLGF
jgi:putative tricarboxylic transport membrane protein